MITEAAWTLRGSSEFAVAGESFTFICNPQNSNAIAVIWKRLDIDTTATGTSRAVVEANGCKIGSGSDTQYQYTCEPGPVYKLTIPANVMTNSQNNIVWRCDNFFGGAAAEYKVKVHVQVSNVYIQADNAVNQVNVIYENIPMTFYCKTNGCHPKANVTVTTTGVTKGQLTESTTQNGDLIITRVSQVITANRGGSTAKTIQCSTFNIQGRPPVTSQLVTLDVFYIPSVEPTLTGYTNGTVLYEGDKDLTVICQQSGGYPLSVFIWSCDSQTGTSKNDKPIISLSNRVVVVAEGQDVEIICSAFGNPTPIVNWHRENLPYAFGTETSATLALERTTRNDTGIYKCKANTRENSGIFINFTINKATPVCSSSESISISCCSVINYSKPLKFYGWKHRIGNTTVRSLEGKLSTMNYNTLSIDYCGYYDSGIYTCEAAVDLHNNKTWYSFSSSIELVVTAPPVVASNMLDTDLNKKRKMSVKFYSVPKPDIVEWIKDGEKLTLSNKYQQITSVKNVTLLFYEKTVIVKGYESSMSIVNPVESDFGTYTFRVQNSEGSAQVKLQMDSVSVCKDQISDIEHESGNNEENKSYQDVDIQMYEELGATNKDNSPYDTLHEQRITCDTQQ
ncbi:hypothetical protein KUTeg_006114 [Tegillarca granosa]|uniref:Ig-like domain-containing protein n=1 Tax=Tegillarca granosa TaxID=220873 RepID=A0ABQ9FFM4_TEGGR|nr:hypothetical protein KUTeg_006114 [Tegillarca granosa]